MPKDKILILLGAIWLVYCEANETSIVENKREGKFAFLNGATNMIASMAQDLISRSATSSQVLSLNLTNLLILLVLKAIIFGASSFGYGYGAHGRSMDNILSNNIKKDIHLGGIFSEEELIFMLTFLQADSTEKYDCLHLIACQDPSKAKEYLLAGKVFLKGTELVKSFPDQTRYSRVLNGLKEAISYGLNNENCSTKYQCNIKSI